MTLYRAGIFAVGLVILSVAVGDTFGAAVGFATLGAGMMLAAFLRTR